MDLMQPFLRKWHEAGIQCFIYLDDILIIGTKSEVIRGTKVALHDLSAAGMVINFSKSILEPVQKLRHLGFDIDFRHTTLNVPLEKQKKSKFLNFLPQL